MNDKTQYTDFQLWLTTARESLFKLSIPQFSRVIKELVVAVRDEEKSFDRYQRSLETSTSSSTTIRLDWMCELTKIIGVDFGAEKNFILQAQSVADVLWKKSHDYNLSAFDENFRLLLDGDSNTSDIDKGLIRLLPYYEGKSYIEIVTKLPIVAYHSRNYFVAMAYLLYKDNAMERYSGKISGVEYLLGSVDDMLDECFRLLDRLIGKSQEYETLLNQYNTIKHTIWGNDDPLPQSWARAGSREENQRIIWAQQEFKMNRRLAIILIEICAPFALMAGAITAKLDQTSTEDLLKMAPQVNQFVPVLYSNVQYILSYISEICDKNWTSIAQEEAPMPTNYPAAITAMTMVHELCRTFPIGTPATKNTDDH